MIRISQNPYIQQDLTGPKSEIFGFKKSEAENENIRENDQNFAKSLYKVEFSGFKIDPKKPGFSYHTDHFSKICTVEA